LPSRKKQTNKKPHSEFTSSKVVIKALASFDIGIRQASAFAAIFHAVAS